MLDLVPHPITLVYKEQLGKICVAVAASC
jgi:hypothetical protein